MLYKPTYTKPVPPQAEIIVRKKERVARWADARGKTHTASVTTTKKGVERLVFTSPFWRFRYRDGAGIVRDVATGCRDEVAARGVANDLRRRAELIKSNVITTAEAAAGDHADRPINDHFDGYIAHLNAKGNAQARIFQVRARLDRLSGECGFDRLSQMNAGEVERWLVARKSDDMAAATRNSYREAIVGFGNWCRRTHRLIINPFIDVPRADVKSDRRRVRRALTEDELVKLLAVARSRPLSDALLIRTGKRKGQSTANIRPKVRQELDDIGRERALIYKTLLLTGLRKGELASITVGNIDLDAGYITLNAADEKNRQGADIPLRADLVCDLRQWLASKLKLLRDSARLKIGQPIPLRLPADTRLFNVPGGLIRILDRDLVAAGIAHWVKDSKTGRQIIDKCDDRGRTIDIHAFRTTFGTHLSKGGVSLRTAQAAMRHSKPDLTANVYTDPKLLDVAGALNALPTLSLDPTVERQKAKATGTENADVSDALALPIALPNGNPGECKGTAGHGGRKNRSDEASEPTCASDDSVNRNGSQSTGDYEPVSKAGEGGRTLDIHVGNVTLYH